MDSHARPRWHVVVPIAAVVVLGLVVVHLEIELARLSGRVDALQASSAAASLAPATSAPSAAAAPPAAQPPPTGAPPAATADAAEETYFSCDRALPPDALGDVLARHGHDVFECVATREAAGVDIAGRLLVALLVQPDGTIQSTRLDGTIVDPDVTSCVANRALEWRAPPLGGDGCAEVHLPFRFDVGR